jgi:hypothetical protein
MDAALEARLYREQRAIEGNPIVDKRKGDRHKPRKHKGGKPKTKWERRLVVAWDGEGANLANGEHIYNLLANSDGFRLIQEDGIPTLDALNFMVENSNPKAINVIYGGSYDVNMILNDVPPECLKLLWTEGSCYWNGFRIFYAPRKKLTIQKFYRNSKGKLAHKDFTLWDVLGYFQATFVVACRKWLGELPILDEIESMKFERSVFTPEKLPEIIEYNRMECELLVKLMHALFEALDNAGIKLIRYDGAGSIAAALLRKNNVTDHKGSPDAQVLRWGQHAYSGGRIEAPKIGTEERPIYRYDINSAYPSGCLTVPSYQGASWSFDKEWDGQDCSMVHIRWDYPTSKRKRRPFYPLWYREYDGTILYPSRGEGIYWGVEVRNVIDYMDPTDYEILGACNVHLANNIKPFAYLQDMYDVRLVLKQAGDMAAEAFKLGMNSTYGKLAQQAGYRNGRIPTYHQLLWAGQITAYTRAQLYRAAMQRPKNVVAFATDAVITTAPLKLDIGTGLGEWTADKFHGITIVQPGVYWLKESEEYWSDKYRGFDKGSLMREHIIECWRQGTDYEARLTRFVGLGSALMSTDFYAHWRKWETQSRTLTLSPSGKRMPSEEVCYWEKLCDTIARPNMHYDGLLSKPYPLLWVTTDEGIKPVKVTEDLGTLEDELMDSYA